MRRHGLWIALLGVACLAALPSLADEEVTLEGGFVWERSDGNHEGDLKAVLTPTGDGEWDVSFYFDWEDGPHVYTGSCSGSLDGELSGDIVGDGERKPEFKFTGSFEDGTFSGTHERKGRDGEFRPTGTMTLGMP
ncbi:MAG: hypothetical protein GTN57_11200 [Acidobacteria bacterium]|nr:hypothetical protein [Acidobacteriota bacterium]NIQ86121.1 hypothetical protein [Acidobacteriota bacterium]NIT11622.1 hypothetical protein [Acidobacteriota bacterium]